MTTGSPCRLKRERVKSKYLTLTRLLKRTIIFKDKRRLGFQNHSFYIKFIKTIISYYGLCDPSYTLHQGMNKYRDRGYIFVYDSP